VAVQEGNAAALANAIWLSIWPQAVFLTKRLLFVPSSRAPIVQVAQPTAPDGGRLATFVRIRKEADTAKQVREIESAACGVAG
jgi:hypothetical protein